MSRFEPETLAEALARPIAMATPEAGVYSEFIAPDFRFLFALALLGVVLATAWRRRGTVRSALLLAGLVAASFVPWLLSSGNGRYFVGILLIAGPLCIGLVHALPASRGLRLLIAMALLGWQGFLLHEVSPWNAWTFVQWRERDAFPVDVPADLAQSPATYVTLSNISYSLIAPRFHPQSRWINLSRLTGGAATSPDMRRAKQFLAISNAPRLLFPSLPGMSMDGQPRPELHDAVNAMLWRHELVLEPGSPCRFLHSAGLEKIQKSDAVAGDPQGFWLCELRHERHGPGAAPAALPSDPVFDAMERACPRLFRRGEAATVPIPAGAVREYQGADTRLYVLNDGSVMYKYMRSLNPVVVGTADAVLAGRVRIDCEGVQGRTAFPWQREI